MLHVGWRCLLACGPRAVGSECARGGCGCDSSKSFTFTFFYVLLCFGIAAGGRQRRTCVYVTVCVRVHTHAYMSNWIRRRGPPAVRCRCRWRC